MNHKAAFASWLWTTVLLSISMAMVVGFWNEPYMLFIPGCVVFGMLLAWSALEIKSPSGIGLGGGK